MNPFDADDATVRALKEAMRPAVPIWHDFDIEADREQREAAFQLERRAQARAWQLAFNRLFPRQAVPV